MADNRYLLQRKQGWYVRIRVPNDLVDAVGKKEFVVTLSTRSVEEARTRRWEHVAAYNKHFELLRSEGNSSAPRSTPQGILDYYKNQRNIVNLEKNEVHQSYLREMLGLELDNEIDNFESQGDRSSSGYRTDKPELTAAYAKAVRVIKPTTPDTCFLDELLAIHINEIKQHVNIQTYKAREKIVSDFITWLGDPKISEVTKKTAGAYTTKVIAPSKAAPRTKKDKLSELSTFFNWCQERGMMEVNPFKGLSKTIKASTKGTSNKRRAFTNNELVKLLSAIKSNRGVRDPLWPLTVLALYTGMRSNEICELETSSVHDNFIEIDNSKSEAGVRNVPIHPDIREFTRQLKAKSKDGYLISNLKRGGVDNKRNHVISKRFTTILRATNGADIQDKNVVFHCLRKNMSTALEAAGVPESTAQQIVGHEKTSMTYGLYSDGVPMDVLELEMSKVRYSDEISSLIQIS